jgi:hypothetical protein
MTSTLKVMSCSCVCHYITIIIMIVGNKKGNKLKEGIDISHVAPAVDLAVESKVP